MRSHTHTHTHICPNLSIFREGLSFLRTVLRRSGLATAAPTSPGWSWDVSDMPSISGASLRVWLKRQAPSSMHQSLPSATSTHSPPDTQPLNPSRRSQTYTGTAKCGQLYSQPRPHENTDRTLSLMTHARAVAIVTKGTVRGEFNKSPLENGIFFLKVLEL